MSRIKGWMDEQDKGMDDEQMDEWIKGMGNGGVDG